MNTSEPPGRTRLRRLFSVADLDGVQRVPVIAAMAAVVAAIGWLDYLTGPTASLSIFYLLPVSVAVLLVGRTVGIFVALLAGASSLLCDVVLLPRYSHRAVGAWNTALMVATLIVLAELIDRLQQRTAAALETEQHGREFLSYAAHQLRTPIASIRSAVDALAITTASDPDVDGLLLGLARDADRAGRLLASLLRLARLDQNEPLPLRPTDVTAIVKAEVERATARSPRPLLWNVETLVMGDSIATCNPDAVAEAVANIVDNAIRHADRQVSVTVRGRGDDLEVAIADDGPGLTGVAQQQAFDRFVSLDGCGGTGLGLTIARGICEAHGGSLDYRGHAFVLRIPRRATR